MPNPKGQPQTPDPDQFPSPSGEEIVAGALAEMLEQQGIDPSSRASSPLEPSTHEQEIPAWFQKLSDSI